MTWLRVLRVSFERIVVMLVLWVPMLLVWGWMMRMYFEGLATAARAGTNIEPSELVFSVPLVMLVVTFYLAGGIVNGRERYWSTRGW
jgi:uncharacterized membrane protein (DUF106 family)